MNKIMTRQEMRRWARFCKKHINIYQRADFMEKLIRDREKLKRK